MDREEKDTTEEVEEQSIRVKVNEDEPDSDSAASDSAEGDDDSDVDEQRMASDATLKHAIEHIADALAALV